MVDKNGNKILAGVVVKVAGAYFKADNGLYYVEQDGSNPGYSADDTQVTLYKICRNGKPSKTKYSIAFFPLTCFVSNKAKAAEARSWNKLHATIEVVDGIPKDHIIDKFEEEAKTLREQERYYKLRNYPPSFYDVSAKTAAWCEGVVKRMRKETT